MANKKTEVIIVGTSASGTYGVWARGEDVDKAKRQFRAEGGGLSRGYTILTFKPGQFRSVTAMGGVQWEGDNPEVVEVKPAKKYQRKAS